jgi:two-component system, sensor histidine kinase
VALAGAERANYQMGYGMAMVVAYPSGSEEGKAWARSVTSSLAMGERLLAQAADGLPRQRREIAVLLSRLQNNKAALDGVVEFALLGQHDDADRALRTIDPRLAAFGSATHEVIDRAVAEQRDASAALAARSARTAWWLVGVSIAGACLAVFGALRLTTWTITRPLDRLRVIMDRLAAGDHGAGVDGRLRGDEIGAMARAVQVFKENALTLDRAQIEHAELTEAQNRAEAAKTEFLAHMSHELRTPLNGMLTMAQLMDRGDLEPPQREKLKVILSSGQDLLHVINDVLDISKIEQRKLELETIEFDPMQVIEQASRAFAVLAEGKDLRLDLQIDQAARGTRVGDPARLRQIVNNFLSNAIKFTEAGGVCISVIEDATHTEGVILAVSDTGPGIAEESIPRLFKTFSQADASITRRYGDTGLGLAICAELSALMGGRVWVESQAGSGSTFYALLVLPRVERPAAPPVSGLPQDQPASNVDCLRVLAADDNPTNHAVLKAIMDAFGCDLTLAVNGRQALELWRRAEFDVILMDIQMPEMDGIAATRAIRAEETSRPRRTPIIAVSANAFRHQIDAYKAAGMDDYVSKPIDVQTLRAVIEGVLQPS